MARRAVGCLDIRLPPCWLRLRRGGCGVAWASKRPCFVNWLAVAVRAARAAQSEFHGAPRSRTAAGLPPRSAWGSQTGGRLFFAYFLLEGVEEIYFNRPSSIRACASQTHACA